MFKIAVCDDEATSLVLNESLADQILLEEGIAHEIVTFSDMRVMIDALLQKGTVYDVLLCDILAVGMNGIEAAEELRKLGEKLPIIFISSTAAYALEGYRVNALRYLQKPVNMEQLREALLEAYRAVAISDVLTFQVADRLYRIPYSDVEYLESHGRDTDVVTKEETISAHIKFSDMEKELPADSFLRCHRSYIINLRQAKDLARYRFLTKSGVEIPVSQIQYSDVKKRFMQFH